MPVYKPLTSVLDTVLAVRKFTTYESSRTLAYGICTRAKNSAITAIAITAINFSSIISVGVFDFYVIRIQSDSWVSNQWPVKLNALRSVSVVAMDKMATI